MPRMTADVFARVLRRLEAGDSVPQAAEAEGVTVDQIYGRLRKLGMGVPRRQPQTAAELDRLLYPNDPPLTQRMLDYLAAFDARMCDPDNPLKFVEWRQAAHELLGSKVHEPPMNVRVLKEIADARR